MLTSQRFKPYKAIINVPYDCFIDTKLRNTHINLTVRFDLVTIEQPIFGERKLNIQNKISDLILAHAIMIDWNKFNEYLNNIGNEYFNSIL